MNSKQVIVIRKDLKMRRGKEIAQGSHASMAILTHLLKEALDGKEVVLDEATNDWLYGSFTKICLIVRSEEELLDLHQAATEAGLKSYLIKDKGLTEFGGVPTFTALAIGPDVSEEIDKITGHLQLY